MAEEPGLTASKTIIDAAKGLLDVVHATEGEKTPARAGPLVVVGRFYVSMTLLIGAVASVAALVDAKTGHEPSCAVTAMRFMAVGAGVTGIVLSVVLLIFLLTRHHLMIFSPSELSAEAQQRLFGAITKEEDDQQKVLPAPPPPPEPIPK